MKKLSLILVCLFVSFEVKSKDDLNGKNLFCSNWFSFSGYEFLKDFKVRKYRFLKSNGESDNTKIFYYDTTNTRIHIKSEENLSIDRLTLKVLNRFEKNWGDCQVVPDLKSLIKKKKNEVIENIKSKQKI